MAYQPVLKIAAGGPDNTNSIVDDPSANTDPNSTNTVSSTNVAPAGYTSPTGGTNANGGVTGFLNDVGQFVTGSNNPLVNGSVVPAEAMAIKQWNDANTYRELGNQAAATANPFGNNNNRQQYIDELSALYKDPSQIANTPGYKFALNQALDATQGRLSAMGYGGTGTMADSLAAQASGLAAQTWNTEANRLAMLGGAQFDPANAARMQMEGGNLAVTSQNQALQSMFAPFGMANTSNTNGNGGGGSGGTVSAGRIATDAINAINAGGAAGLQAAGHLLDQGIRYITNPDGTTTDLQAYAQHGGDNGDGTTTPYYPTNTASQYTDDPSSQFYNGPQDTASIINNQVPEDPNSPYFNNNPFDPSSGIAPPDGISMDDLFPEG